MGPGADPALASPLPFGERPRRTHDEALGPRVGPEPLRARTVVAVCAAGVLLRLAFLVASGTLELQSDEANYLYLAISWNWFGFYSDAFRYLWPPGYPFVLAKALAWFGTEGLWVVKLVQVLASASIGASTMLFAQRLFGSRAALLSGIAWCVYLPLIGYTHYFWTETLFLACFLPALYLLLRALQDGPRARDRGLVLAGVLYAGALYFKEAPAYLTLVLAALLALLRGGASLGEGLRRASLFLLSIAVLVAPWTLRNLEVYGRFVPVGTSLGENFYGGVNREYKNFDLRPFGRVLYFEVPPEQQARRWFVEPPPGPGWLRAEEIKNTPDRLDENVRRGFAYAAAHPGWLVRSRIKKLADLVVPFSFFTRHAALGHYEASVLGAPGVRHALVGIAMASSMLVLLLGSAGFLLVLRDRAGLWLVSIVLAYFGSASLIVAMSRFRIPLVPFLIVLSAGLLTHWRGRRGAAALVATGAFWAALAFLWWVDLPELASVTDYAWRAGR